MKYNMTRQDPFRNLMEEFFGMSGGSFADVNRTWTPACDVERADDHFLLTLELPGVPKDQIKIDVADRQLTVSAERKQETKSEEGDWYTERRYGSFERTFTLPDGVDLNKIEANYQHGLLRLYIPKAESAKPKQIAISEGTTGGVFSKLLNHKGSEKVA